MPGAQRRFLPDHPHGQGRRRHRHHRPVHQDRASSCTSGEELQADIIVTATGLNMQLLGGVRPTRNGEPVDLTSMMTYKGMMFSGVPNLRHHLRIHERVMDAEGRPGVRIRLPRAELHGRQRVSTTWCREQPGDDVDERPFMDFTPRLLPALDGPACPSRGHARRGGSSRTICSTCGLIRQRQGRRRGAFEFTEKAVRLVGGLRRLDSLETTTMPSSSL